MGNSSSRPPPIAALAKKKTGTQRDAAPMQPHAYPRADSGREQGQGSPSRDDRGRVMQLQQEPGEPPNMGGPPRARRSEPNLNAITPKSCMKKQDHQTVAQQEEHVDSDDDPERDSAEARLQGRLDRKAQLQKMFQPVQAAAQPGTFGSLRMASDALSGPPSGRTSSPGGMLDAGVAAAMTLGVGDPTGTQSPPSRGLNGDAPTPPVPPPGPALMMPTPSRFAVAAAAAADAGAPAAGPPPRPGPLVVERGTSVVPGLLQYSPSKDRLTIDIPAPDAALPPGPSNNQPESGFKRLSMSGASSPARLFAALMPSSGSGRIVPVGDAQWQQCSASQLDVAGPSISPTHARARLLSESNAPARDRSGGLAAPACAHLVSESGRLTRDSPGIRRGSVRSESGGVILGMPNSPGGAMRPRAQSNLADVSEGEQAAARENQMLMSGSGRFLMSDGPGRLQMSDSGFTNNSPGRPARRVITSLVPIGGAE
ncbi:hypothetical protein FOA52_003417 [Chlamydomonas sp. UWO 241]|nr:hypothetical protein FOA52_003417 [Chlamydomonas sp. UWO 241]